MKLSSEQFCDEMNKKNMLIPYSPTYVLADDFDEDLIFLEGYIIEEEEED